MHPMGRQICLTWSRNYFKYANVSYLEVTLITLQNKKKAVPKLIKILKNFSHAQKSRFNLFMSKMLFKLSF